MEIFINQKYLTQNFKVPKNEGNLKITKCAESGDFDRRRKIEGISKDCRKKCFDIHIMQKKVNKIKK